MPRSDIAEEERKIMKIRAIRNEKDYDQSLAEIDRLMGARSGSLAGDRLEVLSILVADYEARRYPMRAPDAISAIKTRMTERGLKRSDLAPFLGGKSRVSEVLSRKRPLSIAMIRKLHRFLNIPAEILIGQAEPRRRRAA